MRDKRVILYTYLGTQIMTSLNLQTVVEHHARHQASETGTKEDMHPGVFRIFLTFFALKMAGLFLVFWGDRAATGMLVVSTLYGVMYFGLPLLAQLAQPKGQPWEEFLKKEVHTFTGAVSGQSALIQICTVPLMVASGALVMCMTLSFFV